MEDDWVDLYNAGEESVTNEETVITDAKGSKLVRFLEDVKLDRHYKEKLSMSTILQIDANAISDEPVKSKTDMAWYFLKRLMMANVTARHIEYASVSDPDCAESTTELNFDDLLTSSKSDTLNPLDIITALFLCSDAFVQQELSLKMSMCQFAVPLLLPDCDTNQCTLMLWALRDIVKKYRPKSLTVSKSFKEERIVHSEIPMISFVRLGECSLSKSEILNKLLSNSQQYHDTFVHRNMQSGDCPRTISNGLAEITWYLPCGNKNIDIFDEPVAVVNLHGDIASFETQYSFLCQVSSAVFVLFENFDLDYSVLRKTNAKDKEKIHLVVDQKNRQFNTENLKVVASSLGLNKSRILVKTTTRNEAGFVKALRDSLTTVIEKTITKTPIEKMADIALNLGISTDEWKLEIQNAKQKANALTEEIDDILKFKEMQLPLQGQTWKELTLLEKEEFRLRKVGTQSIEQYKSNLKNQKEKLRAKQNSHDMTDAMSCFIHAISSPGIERSFFLKWLRINLDNLAHDKLSGLREQYKQKCNDSENKEEIKEIDRQLSNSSLGTEHFFREMGQIYEASVSLPENDPSRQQLQHLPRLCAQLLLDGFPLELVDGDASNIPLRWVSEVLAQLHELVSPNNKILVMTVLGVQSTGKSTLLNTMFGVQFAVSSGRCTRGAFMLLIRISEDMKQTLKCDFLVIIDTEGLKSPELAQLDDSHEHDNELATLVVGLSDITIINIAMENSTEMKDILQIVVHAFLRMKEVGKRPKCQFVHQNVSDVSAHDKNLRDRKLLLQQLNKMTQAAAKMESKDKYKSFTDVMDYDPDTGNWYIPGLWNGNPPMAPVNAGYSEAVYELKKNVMHNLENCTIAANDILEFREWITSLWNAVKHENFIFSFRNSLVADAYMRLCNECNKWEWDLKKDMYSWVTMAQTRIKNFGTIAVKVQFSDVKDLLNILKVEATEKLLTWENTLLNKLTEYFKQKEGHVYLVERYKQEFENSIKSLRKELEHSVTNELTAAADMKQGQAELDRVKEKHTKGIELRVCELIENCRKKHAQMTEKELDREFDDMWNKTVKKIEFFKQSPIDIFDSVTFHLRQNMKDKGSHACQELSKKSLTACGLGPYKCAAEGWFKQFTHTISKWVNYKDSVTRAQKLADRIIAACQQCVDEKVERKNNYHDTYIQEILNIIDKNLDSEEMIKNMDFEVSLKQHICAGAARQFEKMHEYFLQENDPYQCLVQNKNNFRTAFKDVFYERDQCQKKAEEFANNCLRPAITDFINRSLGPAIVSEMLTCQEFSTRMVFQYSVLLDLLQKDNFSDFLEYICSYEIYVKQWIRNKILGHFVGQESTFQSENQLLESCLRSINDALMKAKAAQSVTVKEFVEIICKELGDKLVISHDAFGTFMILNNANYEQFGKWLEESVNEMAQSFREKFKGNVLQKKLQHLHVKPQDELFDKVIGCCKQCPFCTAPCDAGGRDHSGHWSTMHRPQAFGAYRWNDSKKLDTDICSSLVVSDCSFQCKDTDGQWRPYKKYREIYPAWNIAPDISLKASDYWKHVLAKFNNDFAEAYCAEPADIPEEWNMITKKQAEESLKQSFGFK